MQVLTKDVERGELHRGRMAGQGAPVQTCPRWTEYWTKQNQRLVRGRLPPVNFWPGLPAVDRIGVDKRTGQFGAGFELSAGAQAFCLVVGLRLRLGRLGVFHPQTPGEYFGKSKACQMRKGAGWTLDWPLSIRPPCRQVWAFLCELPARRAEAWPGLTSCRWSVSGRSALIRGSIPHVRRYCCC